MNKVQELYDICSSDKLSKTGPIGNVREVDQLQPLAPWQKIRPFHRRQVFHPRVLGVYNGKNRNKGLSSIQVLGTEFSLFVHLVKGNYFLSYFAYEAHCGRNGGTRNHL